MHYKNVILNLIQDLIEHILDFCNKIPDKSSLRSAFRDDDNGDV